MRYLLLIVIFVLAIGIKLFSPSSFLQKPALAINNLQNIRDTRQIAQTYVPPDRGAPKSTTTGGTRGKCLLDQKLTLLLPQTGAGLTISEYPSFYVYIPPYQNAKEADFFIIDDVEKNNVYDHIFLLPEKPGIININVPQEKSPPFKVGKEYIWGVQINCKDSLGDYGASPKVEGIIKRIKPEETLSNKLAGVTPLALPNVYASEGIWYDALASLVQLRSLNLENSQLINDWQELFNSAKSEEKESFINAPLLECCEVEE